MPNTEKPKLVARHKKVAFYGIISGNSETFHRMPKFTKLDQSKNPQTYERQYVDEPFQQSDVTGYSPSISYAFDYHQAGGAQFRTVIFLGLYCSPRRRVAVANFTLK